MIYARQPSDEEQAQLQTMIRRETGRVSQRARMILLSVQHRPTSELAAIFATDKVTVRRWIHRFNMHGPAGLHDVPRPGRPRKQPNPQGEEHHPLPRPAPPVTTLLLTEEVVLEGVSLIPDDALAALEPYRSGETREAGR
jgi:transposase